LAAGREGRDGVSGPHREAAEWAGDYPAHAGNAQTSADYDTYQSLLDAQEQQGNSRSAFESGYATTKDSNEVLTGIEHTGGGRLTANVSFTSRQSPANNVDGSACNDRHISLYLVPYGTTYVMTAAPGDYHAGYSDC
jgi:hypothetical protein